MSLEEILIVVGRVLLGGYFAWAGAHHFFFIEPITKMVADRGVPAPKFVMLGGSAFQIVCGVALALGLCVTAAALGLILFTIVASVMLVNWWDMEGAARFNALNTFKANVALIGGLLIAAFSPSP
jgi:putative oxidoreductase